MLSCRRTPRTLRALLQLLDPSFLQPLLKVRELSSSLQGPFRAPLLHFLRRFFKVCLKIGIKYGELRAV